MALSARQHGLPFAPAPGDQASRLRSLAHPRERQRGVDARPDDRPTRRAAVVTVSSGKGGVGKTTLCVNLAIGLAELGRRVTLIDADLGLANADVMCGLTPVRRLDGVIASGGSLREIAVDAPGGFRLVPGAAGVERMTELTPLDRCRLLAALADLERDSDLVLVDTAAGLGRGVTAFMRSAHAAVVVTTPEPTALADAYALIKCVRQRRVASRQGRADSPQESDEARPMLVVNEVSGEREARVVHARLAAVAERFVGYTLPLLGWVPRDDHVASSVRRRRPVLLDSPGCGASRQVRGLALTLARSLRPAPPVAADAERCRGWSRWLSAMLLRGG